MTCLNISQSHESLQFVLKPGLSDIKSDQDGGDLAMKLASNQPDSNRQRLLRRSLQRQMLVSLQLSPKPQQKASPVTRFPPEIRLLKSLYRNQLNLKMQFIQSNAIKL